MHPVELKADVDAGQADVLVVGIQPQCERNAGREASEQEFVGCGPSVRPAHERRFVAAPRELTGLHLDRRAPLKVCRDDGHVVASEAQPIRCWRLVGP